MRAIAVGDETGIGAAVTVGRRDRNTENNLKKGADMSCQVGKGGWYHRVVVV